MIQGRISKKSAVELSVCGIVLTVLLVASALLLQVRSVSAVFAMDYFAILFLAAVVASIEVVLFEGERNGKAHVGRYIAFLIVAVLGGVALEAGTLFGSPFCSVLSLADWSLVRVAIFSCVAFALELACVYIYRRKRFKPYSIRSNWRSFAVVALIAAGIGVVSIIAGRVAEGALGLSSASVALFSFLALLCISAVVLIYRKGFAPERLFLCISLAVGIGIAVIPPAQTGLSWDDQIHYSRALALSYGYDAIYGGGDWILTELPYHPDDFIGKWDGESISVYHSMLDGAQGGRASHEALGFTVSGVDPSTLLSVATVGYVPNAIGLWIGRFFHLPFSLVVIFGKLSSLFCYSFICYFAIKIIPAKKTLLSCVALLPTSIFLASNYSYDAWLISFLMLAVALFVREYLTPDKKMTRGVWAALLVLFLVGLGPKAVYFPLIAVLFLMPREKFSTKKRRGLFLFSVVLLILVVIASFCVPFISENAYGGDIRGGAEVDSAGQIGFILCDPLRYLYILAAFLAHYLSIANSAGYSIFFGSSVVSVGEIPA